MEIGRFTVLPPPDAFPRVARTRRVQHLPSALRGRGVIGAGERRGPGHDTGTPIGLRLTELPRAVES